MVQLDRSYTEDTSALIDRLTLMSLDLGPNLKDKKPKLPLSDPTHLSGKHRTIFYNYTRPADSVSAESAHRPAVKRAGGEEAGRGEVTSPVLTRRSHADYFLSAPVLPATQPRLRLSYPVEGSVQKQLQSQSSSYNNFDTYRHPCSRPLTPLLRVHTTRLRPLPVSPPQLDFLKQLPVDITVILLQKYISPGDLLNLRQVSKYYNMLCGLKIVKRRWKQHLTELKLDVITRGQENALSPITTIPMTSSRGVLSPIQRVAQAPARSPNLLWHVLNTPNKHEQLDTPPRAAVTRSGVTSHPRVTRSGVTSHPSKRAPSARDFQTDYIPTPEKFKSTRSRIDRSEELPKYVVTSKSRDTAPSKSRDTAPSKSRDTATSKSRDTAPSKSRDTATSKSRDKSTDQTDQKSANKSHVDNRDSVKRYNFVTPSKRKALDRSGGKGGSIRTPLKTLVFGTPNTPSTCSSKTSLSSTNSLMTPDKYHKQYQSPDYYFKPLEPPQSSDSFKVPASRDAPSSIKSRQRLKRL